MKRTSQIFFIAFFFLYQIGNAQTTVIDSLKRALADYGDDTLKVNTLIALCINEYRTSPDGAIIHGKAALDLSERLNFEKGRALSKKYIGLGYYVLGNYIETNKFWVESLKSFETINDKSGVSNILSNLGALNANQGDDVKALEYHLRSLKVAEEQKDTLRIMTSMINIGVIYLNNPEKHQIALNYDLSALSLAEKLGNDEGTGTVAVNLGEIYFRKQSYDTALFYYEKSLNSFRKTSSDNVPYTLSNIGRVYVKKGEYEKAVNFQTEGYSIAKNAGSKHGMISALVALAETYSDKGDIKKAILTYHEARELASEIGLKKELKNIYEGLSESYRMLSDYSNAFKYQALLTNIKDTLYLVANDNKIQFQQLNYELDKRESQISLLTKDKQLQDVKIKKQRFTQNTFIAGFIIAILISIQAYRNYRRKVKTNMLLHKQKNEIEQQNKNLTISINYAEKIQSAMFPSTCILSEDLFDYFILFKPLDIVSGDYYWFRSTGKTILIAAADCTGHGVPAAFMSILGLTFLNELVNNSSTLKANEVLTRLRDHIIRTLHQKHIKNTRDGMEMALFILDLENNILQFSGARRPLYLVRNNQLIEFTGDKIPLGIYDDKESTFTNKEIEFKRDDVLYLFSDGYVDQLGGPDRKSFRTKQFKEMLLKNSHLPMSEQKTVLETALDKWRSDTEQIDDILVIGIKLKCGAEDVNDGSPDSGLLIPEKFKIL